ncbi:MAG TPA: pseudouridine synthase [Pirellulales bacterium]|jgi:RluA family pseudouridine synthase|nr:pseudouridine synthase [Pirellulales bacterium]
MAPCINISGYRFTPLAELKPLRERLLKQTKAGNLKGTILLSTEGINLFVAGERAAIETLLAELRAIPGLADFQPKESHSAAQPFNRMLVRIKREIIAFGVPEIVPGERTSPKLAPRELKQWLDEGRPIRLLDTRNDYEVKLGTFRNAVTLGLDHFRHFPEAAHRLPEDWKKEPLVMFCTGGIRCEKAGPFLEREGFEQVFQLDGGILKYFAECGGAHYAGECFVFDQRVGVDPSLAESESSQCYRCLTPLTAAEQLDPRYVPGQSCPYCYRSPAEEQARVLALREAALARATTPLPGSIPADNDRPIQIAQRHAGLTLLETLCEIFPHLERAVWQDRFAQQRLLDEARLPVAAERSVQPGERYFHRHPGQVEPDINPAIRLLYEDAALLVVNKPAPLPLHPCGRFQRNTLQAILNEVYAPQKLRPVHRLDANTTGLVVLARTRHVAQLLQAQFVAGTVEKEYLARVQGTPPQAHFACEAKIGARPSALGARTIDPAGLAARTEFQVLRNCADGTTLLRCRPQTGRTNQIRLHLADAGWPIVGEQAYLGSGQLGEQQTALVTDPPLCLHASRLAFLHPLTRQPIAFSCPLPPWADE